MYQVVQHFTEPESKCVCFVHIHPPILKAEIPLLTFYWNLAKKTFEIRPIKGQNLKEIFDTVTYKYKEKFMMEAE